MLKTYISTGILSVAIGLLMLFAPEASVSVVVILLGVAAIVNGLYNIVSMRLMLSDPGFRRVVLIRGIVSVIVGLIAISLPLLLAGVVWAAMSYVLGAYLVLSAITQIYTTIRLKQAGYAARPYLGEFILSIILAALMFIFPAKFGILLIRILGAVFIAGGAGLLIWEWKNRSFVIQPDAVIDSDD